MKWPLVEDEVLGVAEDGVHVVLRTLRHENGTIQRQLLMQYADGKAAPFAFVTPVQARVIGSAFFSWGCSEDIRHAMRGGGE